MYGIGLLSNQWRRARDSNLDTLLAYTRLAGEHLRPLGQLSNIGFELK